MSCVSFSAGEDFCHTLHIMDSRGESVVVNKKCADRSECSPQRVGCLSIDTQTVSWYATFFLETLVLIQILHTRVFIEQIVAVTVLNNNIIIESQKCSPATILIM